MNVSSVRWEKTIVLRYGSDSSIFTKWLHTISLILLIWLQALWHLCTCICVKLGNLCRLVLLMKALYNHRVQDFLDLIVPQLWTPLDCHNYGLLTLIFPVYGNKGPYPKPPERLHHLHHSWVGLESWGTRRTGALSWGILWASLLELFGIRTSSSVWSTW